MRCPQDHFAVPVPGSYDVTAMCLTATGLQFFSNLSLCGVKQNRRGHDACQSVPLSQDLPAEAARKLSFGQCTGVVYSSEGKCNRGINAGQKYCRMLQGDYFEWPF